MIHREDAMAISAPAPRFHARSQIAFAVTEAIVSQEEIHVSGNLIGYDEAEKRYFQWGELNDRRVKASPTQEDVAKFLSVHAACFNSCNGLKIDKALISKLEKYDRGFVTKNEDHVNFFGGNLLGVETVRWTNQDKNVWYDDILQSDSHQLSKSLLALRKVDAPNEPIFNPKFNVSSDETNISMVWLIHMIHTSNLPAAMKEEGKLHVMKILHYKFISSLMYRYFKYPANPDVAKTTYDRLSNKFRLKQLGSWGKLIEAQSKDILDPKISNHFKTYEKFNDPYAIIYMINDIQTRVRQIIRNMTQQFYIVLKSGETGSTSTSMTASIDGELLIKDKMRLLPQYQRYIKSVIIDQQTFIKPYLVEMICNMINTLQMKSFVSVLRWTSHEFGRNSRKYIEEMVDELMIHCFEFMKERNIQSNDLPGLVSKLKMVYMSSKAKDPNLKKIRELGDRIVELSTLSRSGPVKAAERSGLMLYIVVRALTMRHFT